MSEMFLSGFPFISMYTLLDLLSLVSAEMNNG